MIAIDGLGVNHYTDEFEGFRKKKTAATILLEVLEEVLESRRVFIATTECALFDDQPLPLPPNHGIPEEKVPCKPGDVMPSGWTDIVSHCIALYMSARNESEAFFVEDEEPNGAIVVRYPDLGPRDPVMMTAGALKIEKRSVAIVQQNVLAASAMPEDEM